MEPSTLAQQNAERAIEISKLRSQLGSRIRGASIEPEQSCNGRVTEGIQ